MQIIASWTQLKTHFQEPMSANPKISTLKTMKKDIYLSINNEHTHTKGWREWTQSNNWSFHKIYPFIWKYFKIAVIAVLLLCKNKNKKEEEKEEKETIGQIAFYRPHAKPFGKSSNKTSPSIRQWTWIDPIGPGPQFHHQKWPSANARGRTTTQLNSRFHMLIDCTIEQRRGPISPKHLRNNPARLTATTGFVPGYAACCWFQGYKLGFNPLCDGRT